MKKPYKYALWTAGGIWAVAMIALSPQFVAARHETKSALAAFDAYSSSLVNQRFDEAYLSCGADFRNAIPYDQFVSLQQSLRERFGPLKSVHRSSYHIHGGGTPMEWTAAIDSDLVYEKKSLRFRFVFHKEGERWVLFGSEQL